MSLHSQISDILADKKRSLIEAYLDIQQLSEQEYGPDTVVVMEVGSFFEVYGVDNDEMTLGKPKEVAELLNLQLTRKNKTIAENSVKNPLLAGFPLAAFERYMARLVQEEKYTIVMVRQKGVPPKVDRYLDRVLSPGVNFEYAVGNDDNYLTSVVVDEAGGKYSVGYAAIDVTTGKSVAMEMHSTSEDETFALDELFRTLQAHRTTEILLTPLRPEIEIEHVSHYLHIHDDVMTRIREERASNTYQNELFGKVFDIQSQLQPVEVLNLERQPLASEALALLVDFVIGHEMELVQKLQKPTLLDTQKELYLGNNPLTQLNIISQIKGETSVLEYIDFTTTSIGKRLLKERIVHPITDAVELQKRYELAEGVAPKTQEIRRVLKNVYDIERIQRRIALARLHPFELNFLYDTLQAAQELYAVLPEKELKALEAAELQPRIQECLKTIESTVDLDRSAKYSNYSLGPSFFQKGVNAELDELVKQQTTYETQLEAIREKMLEVLQSITEKDERDFIHIKQLDKDGHYISITKSRFLLMEDTLRKEFISLDDQVYAFNDFHFKKQTGNVKVTATIIDELSEHIVSLQQKICGVVKDVFTQKLEDFHAQYGELIGAVSYTLAQVDVAASTARLVEERRFVKPEIVEVEEGENFLELEAVRHPLVEAREENGIYVPNNILLGSNAYASQECTDWLLNGEDSRGMLLYGINASGKSSLMKSIGISVLLAQAGLYVPATRMRYAVFNELFTRINAADDFQRGLSSFGVEMMELRNIFNRCSPRSLVLGDEISHGTETLSAIAIVSAAILKLSQARAQFVFTTHLHQLNTIEQLENVEGVASVHMAVSYDAEKDAVIFNRTLQEGSGSSIYGLEFAQSLHMDDTFIQTAIDIRKELTNDVDELKRLTRQETSKYNKDVLLTNCHVCEEAVEDTHHINPQHTADENGNIGHIHKDHKYNLIPLCKSCHNKAHKGEITIKGYIMTSKGLELEVE